MSHWNYRVIKRTLNDDDEQYAIHEVYYDDDSQPTSWSTDPDNAWGETKEDLIEVLKMQQDALEKPILIEVGEGDTERLEEIHL